MINFQDLNGIQVELSFEKGILPIKAMHVLVIAKHEEKWLLTKHPTRGIEFPGGKVEENETLNAAAVREVLEETNVEIVNLEWFAEYMVHEKNPFCKAVFIAEVGYIHEERANYETDGAMWLTMDELSNCENLSFHMQDQGMQAMLEKVKNT
ncbi:NUDIX domain-containing protein [Psychrobacillus sp. OK032]|uniref:NUDIX domain-containing protein n=1 Tax=Psychrobacillus sp. OK032 TaxID=1884358 RepID=UPI0008BAC80F|nr:NUDIX domain-containing protein [Psychrobacillus sp. OK032]SER92834.1 8-oxo-dGTP diphosphatase [Psychrobacillus sp. OK032]